MPHELFLTTRQTTKIRNFFPKNMLTDIKLSNAKLSQIIQSGGSFGSSLGKFDRKALRNVATLFIRANLCH